MMASMCLMKRNADRLCGMPQQNQQHHQSERDGDSCCFRLPGCLSLSLQEEFHLHAGELDHVMIGKLMRLGIERLAVDHRKWAPSTWVMK